MKFRTFFYPVPGEGAHEDSNAFLASHRVVDVRCNLVQDGRYQVFTVEYLEGAEPAGQRREPRIDYREKLSEPEFAVFSQLRDLRRRLAEEEGVAVYNGPGTMGMVAIRRIRWGRRRRMSWGCMT